MPIQLDDIVLHQDVRIQSGSNEVSASRYEPRDADGPLPALLMSIPYRKDDYITFAAYHPLIQYLVTCDYHVVVTDLIGSGASSGLKESPAPFTGTEAVDVIDWIAEQEWCTGRVGMFGKSYGGRTSLNAASQRPDALEAIVPIFGSNSAYDYNKCLGGSLSFHKQAGSNGPMLQTFQAMPPSMRDRDGRWADTWMERLEELPETRPMLFDYVGRDTKDEYWQALDFDVDRIEVPVFAVSGWRDVYPQAPIDQLPGIDAPKRLLLGPWRHTMPHKGRETAIDFRAQVAEWFDYFLKDEENGALDHAPVEVWTERHLGDAATDGTWRGLPAWPTTGGEDDTLRLVLSENGLVAPEEFDSGHLEREYEYDHTVGIDSADFLSPPVDPTPDDLRSLRFESDALSTPVEWTGTGEATIRLRATTTDPLLVLRVVDVAPDGSASLVTHGRIRTSQRDSYTDPDPIVPGEEYEIRVPFKPKSHVFEAGHRIRVAISGAFFPLMMPTREHGTFTVLSEPTRPTEIRFPGREREPGFSFDDSFEMDPPDANRVPVSSPFVRESDGAWETGRERKGDTARFVTSGRKVVDLPHDCVFTWDRDVVSTIAADDPLTATTESTTEATFEYETDTVRVRAVSRATLDAAFLSETVTVDDEVVFDHTWRT